MHTPLALNPNFLALGMSSDQHLEFLFWIKFV